jgi:hypothetical protein
LIYKIKDKKINYKMMNLLELLPNEMIHKLCSMLRLKALVSFGKTSKLVWCIALVEINKILTIATLPENIRSTIYAKPYYTKDRLSKIERKEEHYYNDKIIMLKFKFKNADIRFKLKLNLKEDGNDSNSWKIKMKISPKNNKYYDISNEYFRDWRKYIDDTYGDIFLSETYKSYSNVVFDNEINPVSNKNDDTYIPFEWITNEIKYMMYLTKPFDKKYIEKN